MTCKRPHRCHFDGCNGNTQDESKLDTEDDQIDSMSDHSAPSYACLPDELVVQILEDIPPTWQASLAAAACVNRQWHECALPILYASPRLYGPNYDRFVSVVCPSINQHVRQSRVASLIRELDLGALVHHSSRSVTARLLGRVKNSLEFFRAPQASFAINCLPALSKCVELRYLDLSLVSESPPMTALFRAIAGLQHLEVLHLPRSWNYDGSSTHRHPEFTPTWPQSLSVLTLSGGVPTHIPPNADGLPRALTELSIKHCPWAEQSLVQRLLTCTIRPLTQLTKLHISQVPRLQSRSLDNVLFILPQLEELCVSAEYVTGDLFCMLALFTASTEHLGPDLARQVTADVERGLFPSRRLHTFELTSDSGMRVVNMHDNVAPVDILHASFGLANPNILPVLRTINVASSLGWHLNELKAPTKRLGTALIQRETERPGGTPDIAGVFIVNG